MLSRMPSLCILFRLVKMCCFLAVLPSQQCHIIFLFHATHGQIVGIFSTFINSCRIGITLVHELYHVVFFCPLRHLWPGDHNAVKKPSLLLQVLPLQYYFSCCAVSTHEDPGKVARSSPQNVIIIELKQQCTSSCYSLVGLLWRMANVWVQPAIRISTTVHSCLLAEASFELASLSNYPPSSTTYHVVQRHVSRCSCSR